MRIKLEEMRKTFTEIRKKLGGKNLVCSISKRVAVCSKHKIKKKKVGADAFTKLNRKKSVVACVQHACTAGTKIEDVCAEALLQRGWGLGFWFRV